MLALGDELLGLVWPGEQSGAAGWTHELYFRDLLLLPRAEAALRQELQRLADAAKRARQGQSSCILKRDRTASD